MELLIYPDQFVIQYSPGWTAVLLLAGLVLFFLSKFWRQQLRQAHKHSFMPGVLFTVSFIFLIGGINFYVYKIVFNKDGIIIFNIRHFNHSVRWTDIQRVDYQEQRITINMHAKAEKADTIPLNLSQLSEDSMDKVKILISYKLKQHQSKRDKQ